MYKFALLASVSLAISLPLDDDLAVMTQFISDYEGNFDRETFSGEPVGLVQQRLEQDGDWYDSHQSELIQFAPVDQQEKWTTSEVDEEWNSEEQQLATAREEQEEREASHDTYG